MPPTSKTPLAAQARCSSSFGHASFQVPQNRPPVEPPSSLLRTAHGQIRTILFRVQVGREIAHTAGSVKRDGATRERGARKGDEKETEDGRLGQRPAFPFRRPGEEHGAERRRKTAPKSLNYTAVAAEAVAGTVPGHTSTHTCAPTHKCAHTLVRTGVGATVGWRETLLGAEFFFNVA
jgi:hypothetical protein